MTWGAGWGDGGNTFNSVWTWAKIYILSWWYIPAIPAVRRLRWEDLEVRSTRATQQDLASNKAKQTKNLTYTPEINTPCFLRKRCD